MLNLSQISSLLINSRNDKVTDISRFIAFLRHPAAHKSMPKIQNSEEICVKIRKFISCLNLSRPAQNSIINPAYKISHQIKQIILICLYFKKIGISMFIVIYARIAENKSQ